MSDTVFTKVDYDLGSLVKYIGLGEIGLPDLQRPFVWKNAKVRDLFDSMYKGYPVGYFLFWQNTILPDAKTIGENIKQKAPRLVIVDGQQRLTSLYAVVNSVKVLRENFEHENIQIAFNPIDERFEVADAAINRDKSFMSDISLLWDDGTDLFEVVDDYIEGLNTTKEVTSEDTKLIRRSISKLQGLLSYPFTALELASDIDEEAVSDVFVRINSKGTPLNQADFILTLMSVFWDEGRTALENFCRDARKPSRNTPSSFNHFIEPSPDQLLRVAVGVAFKRARLKYVYSILRGKDLETEKYSTELRVKQFDLLKQSQSLVLNLQYWHDFMNCIRIAGYRSSKMITSNNNLLFSYMLYLIGRTEYNVNEDRLRRTIAQWFFMSSVTRRYSGSPESAMEFDFAKLRDVDTSEEFLSMLNQVCNITLTNDFWAVSLPNDLATSSSQSPSLHAYHASLVLLDTKALFSRVKVSELLDPSIQANRSSLERHHLFPKDYLKSIGVVSIRDTNQIANYALVEWGDNTTISNRAPIGYLPEMKDRFSESELTSMYKNHALPSNWEELEYSIFLEKRRELLASVIQQGYETLVNGGDEPPEEQINISSLIAQDESQSVEFKSTLRVNLHTSSADPRMELAVLKTIAGFLNTRGGTLIIGLSDNKEPLGLTIDGFANEDKMALHLVNIIKSRIGVHSMPSIHMHFEDFKDNRILVVRCSGDTQAIFVKDKGAEKFYIRTGPSTTELSPSQTHDYIQKRFKES